MAFEAETVSADLPVVAVASGSGAAERRLAVRVRAGTGAPVAWLGGFCSDMRATKALALDAWAAAHGRSLIRFDYAGHGESGGRFEECVVSTWLEDARTVLDRFAGERPVLVGSSMGGWIACLVARERAAQGRPVAGLVLIAPALDFTQDLMWDRFGPDIRAEIERTGRWLRPTAYAPEPTPITRALIEDGRRHRLLDGPVEVGCPVHVLQGMDDPDVPHAHALRLLDRLPAAGALLTLIKDGDHRLSRPQDIALLLDAVAGIDRGRS